MPQIPDMMTAVVLDSYDGAEALRIAKRPVLRPGKNEVLVKVAASPINPSDLSFLEGQYGYKKPTPTVPGFEGSGTVVAVGGGLMGRYLMGKRVACIAQTKGDGVWAEYIKTSVNMALPLADSVSLEQGAMAVVNPLTVISFFEITKAGRHKAIVQSAAASAVGQMVNRLGKSEGVQVINVVRREAQVTLLKQQGASLVLNSSEPDFVNQLRELCHQHKARLAFDAVAGERTLQLLEAMPKHSQVLVYGGLSLSTAQAHPKHLIFEDKIVAGFWLSAWLARKSMAQSFMAWRRVQKLLTNDLRTEIRAEYPLAKAQEAVMDYQSQMTGGKVLIRPDL